MKNTTVNNQSVSAASCLAWIESAASCLAWIDQDQPGAAAQRPTVSLQLESLENSLS